LNNIPAILITTLATAVPTSFDSVHLYTPLSDEAKFYINEKKKEVLN